MLGSWIGADAPHVRGRAFPWRAYGWAVGMVAAVTLLNHLWFGRIGETNLVITYLLGMVPVALRGNRGAAVTAAVLSVAAFDLFFVLPYHTFAVSDAQYFFTFAVMGLVGGLISTLTARLASEVTETRQRERRSRALYELSRALLVTREPEAVMAATADVLAREVGLPVYAWLVAPGGQTRPVGHAEPLKDALEHAMLLAVAQDGVAAGPGTETFPGASLSMLPVMTSGRVHGALALRWPTNESASIAETLAMLETGANQAAIALEEARAQQAASAARAQAEGEQLRNTLLSSVSHDLRTPLTGIVGAASSLVDGAEALAPEVRRELATGIVEEAERLNRLVTNLLHATRLDAGSVQLHREWTSLEDVVAPALARLAGPLAPHSVRIELAPELPLIFVDPVMLGQAFMNLFENAAKYTPPGAAITLSAEQRLDRLAVALEDTGPGLPSGTEERVFEKFWGAARGGAKGAGLGLSIVKGVVQAHGGTVTAANRPQGGAVFAIELPLTAPPAAPRTGAQE